MSWKIEPRPGVEVYVSDAGFICVKQEDSDHVSGESCIVLDPSIVPRAIAHLQSALDEYLDEFHGNGAQSDADQDTAADGGGV